MERLGGLWSTWSRPSGPIHHEHLRPRPRRPARAALVAALLCAVLPAGRARPAAPDAGAAAFLGRLEAAWQARDVPGWLALWDFAAPEQKALEEEVLRISFASDETALTFLRRPSPAEGTTRFDADVQVFEAAEPRARVAYWRLRAEKRAGRWALVERQDAGQIDGLVHLSLGPSAWRARGVSLRLEDFELRMEDGTLFSTPEDAGADRLRLRGPRPGPLLSRPARRARAAPAVLGRDARSTARSAGPSCGCTPPTSTARSRRAGSCRRRPRARGAPRRSACGASAPSAASSSTRPLPRSPWWLMPSLGDAVVDFPWGRKRVLTYVVSSGELEDVNLFDRDRRLQICTYPSGGRAPRYSEDDRRVLDVLDNDITARFDPEKLEVQAEHTMRVRLLAPTSTLRLRLHDDFRVASVTSEEGGSLLFFRVRDQSNLVVSLGPLSTREEPFTLTTRYSGRHDPAPVDQELAQVGVPSDARRRGGGRSSTGRPSSTRTAPRGTRGRPARTSPPRAWASTCPRAGWG